MFKKIINSFLNKQEDNSDFLIPIAGEVIDLADVPDEAFSQGVLGDGFAIKPENGEVFSPVDGTVAGVFPTKHAITIISSTGIELLIHFGVDTVTLNGEGFTTYVEEGTAVKAGDLLLKVNLEQIKDKVPSIISPIIFLNTNGKQFSYNKGKAAAKEKNIVVLK